MNEHDYKRSITQITLLESLLADARAIVVSERYAEQYEDMPGLDRPSNPHVLDKYCEAWEAITDLFGGYRENQLPKELRAKIRSFMDMTRPLTAKEAFELATMLEAYQIPF